MANYSEPIKRHYQSIAETIQERVHRMYYEHVRLEHFLDGLPLTHNK